MTTRSRFVAGVLEFFDSNTGERVKPMAPVVFEDDFFYKTLNTTDRWTAIDVSIGGLTTPVMVATSGGSNGIVRLPLDVTSEAQESGLTFSDVRPFILNRGLMFEARLALQTLPTLNGIAVWGLAGDKNAVANTVAESIWFRANASGAILVESDDTSNEQNSIATGVTLTAGTFAVFRIDCSVITDIKFFINGARVAATTTFTMANLATLALQPYFHIAKASGAGLGVVDLDYVRVWQRRSA